MEPQPLSVNSQDDTEGKTDISDTGVKADTFEDASVLFAPPELRTIQLTNVSGSVDKKTSDEEKHVLERKSGNKIQNIIGSDASYADEYTNLNADYFQLMNYRDCELLASEFRRLALDLHSQNEVTPECHNAAIDALLLAAECYVNPFFVMSFKDFPKVNNMININRNGESYKFRDLRKILGSKGNNLEIVSHLERKRDKIILQILLEAAKLDMEYQNCPLHAEVREEILNLSPIDINTADAITLVRQNQALLCNFLIQWLLREKHSVHEILVQSLVFFLHSATKLYCAPKEVVDIVLVSAEYFNGLLTSFYYQLKEGNLHLDPGKVHEVQRRWMLLQRLVVAASGDDEGTDLSISVKNGFRFSKLIPPSAWMQKIPSFSSSSYPMVRFLGWMAVSRNANQYQKDRLFLASDLSELTLLLSIFADELAVVDCIAKQNDENDNRSIDKGSGHHAQNIAELSFHNMYPDICQFLPNMKKQFESFGEIILEAIGLQLRSLSSSVVPDILCWFSDLCLWPFLQKENEQQLSSRNNSELCKGFVAKNAKAIILYVLEAIVIEHMEAIVPEIPRVVQVLVSLCRASYCDVSFLDSILRLLKPIISYSLRKASDEEKEFTDDSCLNFESLCFDELFSNIRHNNENEASPEEKVYSKPLTIFILASVFPDLSFQRKREILQSLIFWADFASFEPTTSFYDYICAFQSVLESCKCLLIETLRVYSAIPLKMPLDSDMNPSAPFDDSSETHPWFSSDAVILNQRVSPLSVEEALSFSKDLQELISKLNPTIELCWKLHHLLAKKLALTSAQCSMYSRCLSSIGENISISAGVERENSFPSILVDTFADHWKISLEGLAEMIVVLQQNNCWEIASLILDCLLEMPRCFSLGNVIGPVCAAIKNFSTSAPKIAWRLQTDKWLSFLFARGIYSLHESEIPLVDLLSTMLGHSEPEQRFIALQHLGKLVGQDLDSGTGILSSTSHDKLTSWSLPDLVISSSETILSPLVSSTWDRVAVLAASDSSLLLRTRAMALLVDYIPFAERQLLQSLLVAADSILHGLTNLAHPTCEGPLIRLSLALIANVCLYSPAEDISLISQNVWRNIETLGMSETGIFLFCSSLSNSMRVVMSKSQTFDPQCL